jgi:hypothetical protein
MMWRVDDKKTGGCKEAWLNVRIREDVRDEFKLAAELRGASMSGLLTMFIYRVIREEKGKNPEAFAPAAEPGENPGAAPGETPGLVPEGVDPDTVSAPVTRKPKDPRPTYGAGDGENDRGHKRRAG